MGKVNSFLAWCRIGMDVEFHVALNLLARHCLQVLDVFAFTMNAKILELGVTWALFLLFVSSTFSTFASLFLSFGFV